MMRSELGLATNFMIENSRPFYSKIILFGEYSIIRDSRALALPFALYEGNLKFSNQVIPENE